MSYLNYWKENQQNYLGPNCNSICLMYYGEKLWKMEWMPILTYFMKHYGKTLYTWDDECVLIAVTLHCTWHLTIWFVVLETAQSIYWMLTIFYCSGLLEYKDNLRRIQYHTEERHIHTEKAANCLIWTKVRLLEPGFWFHDHVQCTSCLIQSVKCEYGVDNTYLRWTL